jgi:predicted kinase
VLTLVLIYGKSATGKTTLVQKLSRDLQIPGIGLDDIKEVMYDRNFREENPQLARLINQAAFEALTAIARRYISGGNSLIIDVHT